MLDWFAAEETDFGDLGLSFRDLGDLVPDDGEELIGVLAYDYLTFLGWLLAALTAIAALVATWPASSASTRVPPRTVAVVLTLVAAVMQIYTIEKLAETLVDDGGLDMGAGGWIGALGYGVMLVGSAVGPG